MSTAVHLCFLLFNVACHAGPKALPVVGNLYQVPRVDAFKTYAEWARTYGLPVQLRLSIKMLIVVSTGPIVHFSVFGRHFVLLNTHNVILDLLEKRSVIYSSKPRMVGAC